MGSLQVCTFFLRHTHTPVVTTPMMTSTRHPLDRGNCDRKRTLLTLCLFSENLLAVDHSPQGLGWMFKSWHFRNQGLTQQEEGHFTAGALCSERLVAQRKLESRLPSNIFPLLPHMGLCEFLKEPQSWRVLQGHLPACQKGEARTLEQHLACWRRLVIVGTGGG